jgi:hypothetical protein
MKSLDKGKGIKENNCPSPENPCMCDCHTRENECWECRMGRHKPMNQKSLDKQDWEEEFEKEIWHINHKSGLDKFPNRGCNCEMEDDCKKSLKSFIQSELDRQKKEILKEIEKPSS